MGVDSEVSLNNISLISDSNGSCFHRDYVSPLVMEELYPEQCQGYVKLMFGQVFPALAVIITISNLTVVAVFLKPKIRSHTSFILTLIALSDVFNILCPSSVYAYFYTFGFYKDPVPYRLCRWTYYLADIFRDLFNCFSLWLTVLLAYIRTRCITSPLRACEFHTKRNISTAIFAIIVLAVVVYLPALFIFEFIPVAVTSDTGRVTYSCQVVMSDFLGKCVLRRLHMWLEIVLTSFVPCFLLISLNLTMLWSLRRAEKDRDLLNMYEPMKYKKIELNMRNTNREKFNSCQIPMPDDGNENVETELHSHAVYMHKKKDETGISKERQIKHPTGIRKYFVFNSLNKLALKWHGSMRVRLLTSDSLRSHFSAYERLNRESRRTSWYIVLVVTLIASHEIPMAAIICHTLLTHEGTLPVVIYGCSNMLVLLWQYATYALIFLVYCCMCSAFRTELRKTVCCKRVKSAQRMRDSVFTSPCSVRKHLTESHAEGSHGELLTSNQNHSCDACGPEEDLNEDNGRID